MLRCNIHSSNNVQLSIPSTNCCFTSGLLRVCFVIGVDVVTDADNSGDDGADITAVVLVVVVVVVGDRRLSSFVPTPNSFFFM